MIDQAREVFCQARFPASLIYALIVSPSPAVPSTLCRLPLVILQQAAQSFSTPHCSRVPSCLRLQRKQDPIAFALMVALLVVMRQILLQGSPQRASPNRMSFARHSSLTDLTQRSAYEFRFGLLAGRRIGFTLPDSTRNVTMEDSGFLIHRKYLLHDHDSKYGSSFRQVIEAGSVQTLL